MNFKQKDNALLGLVISAILATGSDKAVADAMIVNDGTLKAGTVSVHDNNAIAGGKIYSIDGKQLGKTVGKNLFFSFSEFNINKQDTAQFSCNGCVVNKIENGVIRNIISRVTGSNSSTINGTLDYHHITDVPGTDHVRGVVDANIRDANFWLFNPNGVVLGQGAVVDVPAELHLASASQLNLKTGKVAVALTTTSSSLTAAKPQDFGFLGNEQDITFAPGTTQLKAAGAIEIVGSNLVMVGKSTLQRPARVLFENSGASKLDVNLKTPLLSESNAGNITIGSKALLLVRTPVATLAVNAANDLTNQAGAIIKGKAQANHDLNNAGKITISAKAGNDLINDTTGVIGTQGNPASFAKAGNNLKNNYIIRGNADAGGALDNQGNITGNAKAESTLNNSGSIGGKAIAGTGTLTNQLEATIGNGAESRHSSDVSNEGEITGDVLASNNLTNNGTINGNAQAIYGTLQNGATGTIKANASAGSSLDNSGSIGGKAIAGIVNSGALTNQFGGSIGNGAESRHGADISNDGEITGDVLANNNLTNNGTLNGNAQAFKGALQNTNLGMINANARAGSSLDNAGRIGGKAISGIIVNSGALTNQFGASIGNGAESRHGSDISNEGEITGDTLASSSLINNGMMNGNVYAINGTLQNGYAGVIKANARAGSALDNSGRIGGKAIAGIVAPGALFNQFGASIGNGAESRTRSDITNDGEITGDTFASNTLTNSGTINGNVYAINGALQNISAGMIKANARAGSSLDNLGRIGGKAIAGIATPGSLTNQLGATIGSGAESRSYGSDISNDGEIVGNTQANNNLINNGTMNGDAQAINGALLNTNTGLIKANARAGSSLDNSGSIGGKAIAGIVFTGTLTNQSGAIIGNGAETRNLSGIDNFGKINGDVSAANQLNNIGNIETLSVVAGNKITLTQGGTITSTANNTDKTQLLNIVAREEMEINDGYIIAGDSGQAMSPTNLRIATPIINLTAGHISTNDGAIDIRPDDAVGASAYAESHPAQLNFFGDSSVWAYGDIGTPHNSRSITSPSNGVGDTSIYYAVNFGHSFSNIIGSETAKVLLSTDDIKSLSAVPTNMATLLLPTTEEDWQRQLLLTGNRLINAYASSSETPFASPQPGNLVSVKPTVIFRPQFIPVVASDPCGQGSTLEIRNTKGVILQFDKLLPFSVFPEANDQNKQDKSLNAVMANPEPLVLARLGGKGRACSKG